MATVASLRWSIPPEALVRALEDYKQRLLAAVYALAQLFAAKMESYARSNAPWTDRTGHARAGLTGLAVRTATGVVLYLATTVSYGIYLELKHQGRYAILLPTLERHYPELMAALNRLVSR